MDGYWDEFTDNGDGTFTFTMPQADVSLSVNYGVLPDGLTLLKGTDDFVVTEGTFSRDFLYVLGKEDNNHGCTRLLDDDLSTTWSVYDWVKITNYYGGYYVEFQTNDLVVPKHYILTTGDGNWQNKGRKPKSWKIYAKVKSSDEWTCIADVVNDQTLEDKDLASYTFDFDNPDDKSYKYFYFRVTSVHNFSSMHLSEMQMWVKNTSAQLADNADNSEEIDRWADETTNVKLAGRTLFIDGQWNSLCLPFDIDDFAGTPLEGTTVKELDNETATDGHVTGFDNGTLYLNFKDATSIKAGQPYIVKIDEVDARTIPLTATSGSDGLNILASYPNLVDGKADTKWCTRTNKMSDGVWFCELSAANPIDVTGYELTTGDDTGKYTDRNPIAWTLKGRLNESDEWTTLDSHNVDDSSEDALPEENFAAKSYDIASDKRGKYKYFRFEVSQTSGDLMQLSELTLQGTCSEGTITDPLFAGVTVNNDNPKSVTSSDGWVSFVGTYNPLSIGSNGDNTILYFGVDEDGNSALFYPDGAMTINSCRAYFQLNNGLVAGEPSSAGGINNFVLKFGGEETGIKEILNIKSQTSAPATWYSLDGRKLGSKPTRKGIYIHNGQKIVIK